MYTVKIITQNTECKDFFLSMDLHFKFYKENEDYIFEVLFNTKDMGDMFLSEVNNILCNYDDSDAWIYEAQQEEAESLTEYESGERFY